MTKDYAELLAIKLLAWITSHDEVMHDFLNSTGSDAATLMRTATSQETLGAVLDFMMQSDSLILNASASVGCAPEDILACRQVIGGQQERHWT